MTVYYATDVRVKRGSHGHEVETTIPIAADADEAAVMLTKLRWATFVRMVAARHTAVVAAQARSSVH
jgi:hypothetical protein